MELHYIADDLEEHTWYLDLVADFVEDVLRFAALVAEPAEQQPDQVSRRPARGTGSGSRSARRTAP